MTERFRIQQGYTSQFCYDWQEFQLLNFRQTITLLNSFYKENEQLRKEKECDKQIFTKKQLHELLQQTQKENEHIKQTIREAYETERTQIGKNTLKQLLEALE